MADHRKPTQEELDAEMQASLDQLDALDNPKPDPEEDPKPDSTPEIDEDEREEEENIDDEGSGDEEEIKDEEDPKSDPKKDTPTETKEELEDTKEKLKNSSREAQKLYKDNITIVDAIAEAEALPEPTEEELKQAASAKGVDWDDMSNVEKMLFKDVVVEKRKNEIISKANKEVKDVYAWHDKVDDFVEDERNLKANPELAGKEEAFKVFAKQKDKRGSSFDLLVPAFLHQQSKDVKPKKGKMFETPTGGPNGKPEPKNNKISLEEAQLLMKTDYKKYKEYVMKDMIDDSTV